MRVTDIREVYRFYRGRDADERLLYHPFPEGGLRLMALLTLLSVGRGLLPHFRHVSPRASASVYVVRTSPSGEFVGQGALNYRRIGADGELVARTGIYVMPAARRHGVGRILNEQMVAQARSFGVRRAEALIVPRNAASRATFESMGYRLTPSGIHDLRPPFEEFLLAERDIS